MLREKYKFTEEHKRNISLGRKGKGLGHMHGFKKGQVSPMKGKHHTEEAKRKNSLAHKDKRPWNKDIPITEEQREKIKKSVRLAMQRPEVRAKISASAKKNHEIKNARILKEAEELKKQGFRVIPITKVIPDIIAIKGNKVFAVEVEYKTPNYAKYTDDIRQSFDDIWWIIKN